MRLRKDCLHYRKEEGGELDCWRKIYEWIFVITAIKE